MRPRAKDTSLLVTGVKTSAPVPELRVIQRGIYRPQRGEALIKIFQVSPLSPQFRIVE